MALEWREAAERMDVYLRELLSSGLLLLHAELGLDVGLRAELLPPGLLACVAAGLGLLLAALLCFLVCRCFSKKPTAAVAPEAAQTSRAKPEEVKKRSRKRGDKKVHRNGLAVDLEEELKPAQNQNQGESPDPAGCKSDKGKKNKKKAKSALKETKPASISERKEPEEAGTWETKVSHREKRQQRRKDKGVGDESGSPGGTEFRANAVNTEHMPAVEEPKVILAPSVTSNTSTKTPNTTITMSKANTKTSTTTSPKTSSTKASTPTTSSTKASTPTTSSTKTSTPTTSSTKTSTPTTTSSTKTSTPTTTSSTKTSTPTPPTTSSTKTSTPTPTTTSSTKTSTPTTTSSIKTSTPTPTTTSSTKTSTPNTKASSTKTSTPTTSSTKTSTPTTSSTKTSSTKTSTPTTSSTKTSTPTTSTMSTPKTSTKATNPSAPKAQKNGQRTQQAVPLAEYGPAADVSRAVIAPVSQAWDVMSVNGSGSWDLGVSVPSHTQTWNSVKSEPSVWPQDMEGSWMMVDGSHIPVSLHGITAGVEVQVVPEHPWVCSAPVGDEWSGPNSVCADPVSDYCAPCEEWGNYEEPAGGAVPPDQTQESEAEKDEAATPGSSKAKRKKKKKKKVEEGGNAAQVEVGVAKDQNTAGNILAKTTKQPDIVVPPRVPLKPTEAEAPPKSTAPPSQKTPEESWESPRQVKKKKARRET